VLKVQAEEWAGKCVQIAGGAMTASIPIMPEKTIRRMEMDLIVSKLSLLG